MLTVRATTGVNLPPAPIRCKSPNKGSSSPRLSRRQGALAIADSRANPEQTSPSTSKPGAGAGSVKPNPKRAPQMHQASGPRYGMLDKTVITPSNSVLSSHRGSRKGGAKRSACLLRNGEQGQ